MKAVIQRVSSGSVRIDGETVGAINKRLLVLLGVADGDSESDVRYLAEKVCHLRIFPNEKSKFYRALSDGEGSVPVIS
ncbi:MAG: D-aminoacyl-tRNA deacylase [Oligoflexus sp.]|nr:D-aminoacyl-tRNA deacylase [Oligoflexus sp.]